MVKYVLVRLLKIIATTCVISIHFYS